jgi:hypothetical protein
MEKASIAGGWDLHQLGFAVAAGYHTSRNVGSSTKLIGWYR